MRKSGEITVFLSLILVCVMSLVLGLVESARTAGARLYLEMASHSVVSSVMSQYNRNLWDMYHLLFLEAQSDLAVEQSFASYFEYYLEQSNLYPAKLEACTLTGQTRMAEAGGRALEQEILSYVRYRLPDVAADLAGIADMAQEAAEAGDFRHLFEVCREAGARTRKLEKRRRQADESLEAMHEARQGLYEAISRADEGDFEDKADDLLRLMKRFPNRVQEYEREVQKVSEHLEELREEKAEDESEAETAAANGGTIRRPGAQSAELDQEILAYEQTLDDAINRLEAYLAYERELPEQRTLVQAAIGLLGAGGRDADTDEHEEDSGDADDSTDWDAVRNLVDQVVIPDAAENVPVDREKASALDRLEEVLQGDVLDLVLPESAEVSRKRASLYGVPSKVFGAGDQPHFGGFQGADIADRFLVNEYALLSFDSFLDPCERKMAPARQTLDYEQEYLLCGESSDRDNLRETVERLLVLRGAMNLLYLLRSPEKRVEAQGLAAAVSGGYAPVNVIVTFFVLTLWAFGESVYDVRTLAAGGEVPFRKHDGNWQLELDALLSLRFLSNDSSSVPHSDGVGLEHQDGAANAPHSGSKGGSGFAYRDYLRVLFLLMDREERNYRMMDIIQWNVRSVQSDFAVEDCIASITMTAKIKERHRFLLQSEYRRTVETTGAY